VGNRPISRAFSSEGSEGANNVRRGEYSEHEDAEEEVEDRSYFGNIHWTGTMDAFDQDIDADLEADLEAVLRESVGTTTLLSTLSTTPNVEEEGDKEDDSGMSRWREMKMEVTRQGVHWRLTKTRRLDWPSSKVRERI